MYAYDNIYMHIEKAAQTKINAREKKNNMKRDKLLETITRNRHCALIEIEVDKQNE